MAPLAVSRDKDTTKRALVQAVGSLIGREGFGAIGVNAIAREAGADKVLIYRYFGGLPELLAAYGEQGDFWWDVDALIGNDLPGPEKDTLSAWLALVFRRHVEFLRHHPVTLGILAWEMSERNELTTALEAVREQRSTELMHRIIDKAGADGTALLRYVGPVMALLAGASNYLVTRGQSLRTFSGIDVGSDLGWSQIYETVEVMLAGLLSETEKQGGAL